MPNNQLKLSDYAWKKMKFFSKLADKNEVGGFMITPEHPLHVTDVALVKQEVSSASIDFDDDGLAAYRHEMTDRGLEPWQYERIWWHTHPGFSSTPSGTDEATFKDIFAKPSWAVMFILAHNDETYIRLKTTTPFGPEPDSLLSTDQILQLSLESAELDDNEAEVARNLFNELVTEPAISTWYSNKPTMYWIDGKEYDCESDWVKGTSHRTLRFKDGSKKTFICKWDSKLQGYVVDLDHHPDLKQKAQKKTKPDGESSDDDGNLYDGYTHAELQQLLMEAYMTSNDELRDFAVAGLKLADDKRIDRDFHNMYDYD